VAQLNSALDYGSRGCWFESSRGHLRMESSNESLGFFCKYLVLSSLKKSNIYKKSFQSLIEKAFHIQYGALSGYCEAKSSLKKLLNRSNLNF
jgi:hypothetical protein